MVVREDRKNQIINQSIEIFSKFGYYKTTTAQIAQAAGVTQPYVFHFFKSKEELFKAVLNQATDRILEAFTKVQAPADQIMFAMSNTFEKLMESHRDEMMMIMQAHAISEPSIRAHVRKKMEVVYESLIAIFKQSGLINTETKASFFMGMGFLITIAEVLDFPELIRFTEGEQIRFQDDIDFSEH